MHRSLGTAGRASQRNGWAADRVVPEKGAEEAGDGAVKTAFWNREEAQELEALCHMVTHRSCSSAITRTPEAKPLERLSLGVWRG